jgi:hypothetical protein
MTEQGNGQEKSRSVVTASNGSNGAANKAICSCFIGSRTSSSLNVIVVVFNSEAVITVFASNRNANVFRHDERRLAWFYEKQRRRLHEKELKKDSPQKARTLL